MSQDGKSFTSFQVLFGLATSLPSTGTCLASARNQSFGSNCEVRAVDVGGEDDAVIAEADFDDVLHAARRRL
jgi:hypothetical protein